MVSKTRSKTSFIDNLNEIASSSYGSTLFNVLSNVLSTANHQKVQLARSERSFSEVIAYINEEGQNLDLFSVLRLIENANRQLPKIGTSKKVKEDPIRFGQQVSLNFAPSEISHLVTDKSLSPRLMQYSFGLFGPNGPMPNHLTEYVYERINQYKDTNFADFADVFHHRLISLFYRAWAINQPFVELDRQNENNFKKYVGSFCGFNLPALQNRDGVHDAAKLAHAGLFSRQVRHPEGLKAVLENYFDIKVNILTWVGYWMPIPKSQQTQLGKVDGFSQLGNSAMIGDKVWDVQSSFRVILGPLNLQRYLDFLPNGKSIKKLESLVKLYFGEQYRFQLQMILKKDDVPTSQLGNDISLGWTSWLGIRFNDVDRCDYVLS